MRASDCSMDGRCSLRAGDLQESVYTISREPSFIDTCDRKYARGGRRAAMYFAAGPSLCYHTPNPKEDPHARTQRTLFIHPQPLRPLWILAPLSDPDDDAGDGRAARPHAGLWPGRNARQERRLGAGPQRIPAVPAAPARRHHHRQDLSRPGPPRALPPLPYLPAGKRHTPSRRHRRLDALRYHHPPHGQPA